ncbi:MAG: protein kinase domain-containing protein [Gemmatimonadales bacterium]
MGAGSSWSEYTPRHAAAVACERGCIPHDARHIRRNLLSDGTSLTELLQRLRSALGDRFELQREVGRGGMATVFLALDRKHDRRVALKVLHPELAASLGPERFLREIRTAARLSHPHIIPLHDSGQADGQLYYVMPFIDGESLRDRMSREGRLAIGTAVAIARDVALALDHAHRQGIVHRDIKPENVMLQDDEALVADFGIAKAVESAGSDHLTATGVAVGTPAYMSPEQAAGEREPDGRSDVYSVGILLFEMLCGRAPFAGASAQAMIMKRFIEDAPPARADRAEIPADLDRAVAKALAREPDERYQTAAQFAAALATSANSTASATAATVVLPATPAEPEGKSIAVLPFVNMSTDPENEYFSDGIAEEIINALSAIRALRVAARTSSFAFKGRSEDIGGIGRQLRVTTVLEGSVRKSGQMLRVTAQLVDVAGGYHLWSSRYDRKLEDVFAIQDEIAANIVEALQVVLSPQEKRAIEQAPAPDVQAYDYYLRGRQFLHQFRRAGILFARRMFERAFEADPSYARAYAGAADCCSLLYMYWDASRANLEQAERWSLQALERGPNLADAHASRGLALTLTGNYEDAEHEFRQAIALNPKLFEAHYLYARALVQQGRVEEAVQSYREAARVRPEDFQSGFLMDGLLRKLGRDAEADAAVREAVERVRRHVDLNPDDARAFYLGAGGLVRLGLRDEAQEWARRALAIDPADPSVLYNLACFEAVCGAHERAIDLLEQAVQHGFGNREWVENDPDFDILRDSPRYQALMQRM